MCVYYNKALLHCNGKKSLYHKTPILSTLKNHQNHENAKYEKGEKGENEVAICH